MPDNGDKKLSPYEELEKHFQDIAAPRAIGPNMIAILKFLRILDMKTDCAWEKARANEKILSSLDEEFVLNVQENEALRDKITKEFFNKPAMDNTVETSPEYQQAQGLNMKRPDMEEDEDMWKTEIIFEDPYDQANFDDAVELLQTINPEVSTYKLFKVLTDI